MEMMFECLTHCLKCIDTECVKVMCRKMKACLYHTKSCSHTSTCPTKKFIYDICQHHSKVCVSETCDVVFCVKKREQMQQLSDMVGMVGPSALQGGGGEVMMAQPGVNFQQPSVMNNASYISSTEHMCSNAAFIGEGESRNLDTTVAYTENVSDCNDQQPTQDDEVDHENESEEASPNLATGEMYYQPGDQMLWAQKPEAVDMNALPSLSQDDLNILSRSGVGEMMTPGSHNRLSYVHMESAIEQYHFPQRDDHSEGVVEMDEEPLPRSFLTARDNDGANDNNNNNNHDDDNEDERPTIGA